MIPVGVNPITTLPRLLLVLIVIITQPVGRYSTRSGIFHLSFVPLLVKEPIL